MQANTVHPCKARIEAPVRWGLLAAYALLTLLRAPGIVWPGRFWAEEGAIYFREAFLNSPLQVLFTSNLGYYSLFNKLAAITAVHAVPMEFAPVVTLLFAFAIQLAPVLLLLFSKIPALPTLAHRAAAVGLVLLIQPNQEVWLNTINSQYFLCVAAGIVLISWPSGRAAHALRLMLLGLAGLTGIVSALLMPLFLWAWWRERTRRRAHETVVLLLAGMVQAAVVLAGEGRAVDTVWRLLPLALAGKQWVLPLAGYASFDAFIDFLRPRPVLTRFPMILWMLFPYGLCALVAFRQRNRTAGMLLVAALGIASISLMFSLPAQNVDSFGYSCITATADGRYYFAPNVLLGISLLTMLARLRPPPTVLDQALRSLATLLILLLLATGLANYRHYGGWSHGPSWPAEVRAWREGRTNTLALWPPPWRLDLRPEPKDPPSDIP